MGQSTKKKTQLVDDVLTQLPQNLVSEETPLSSKDEVKARLEFRKSLAEEMRYMRMVPVVGSNELQELDEFLRAFPTNISEISSRPFKSSMLRRYVTEYFTAYDPLSDPDLAYTLRSLFPPDIKNPSVAQLMSKSGKVFAAGYLVTSPLSRERLSNVEYRSEKASWYSERFLSVEFENQVLETLKRAVPNPEYQRAMSQYGAAFDRFFEQSPIVTEELIQFIESLGKDIRKGVSPRAADLLFLVIVIVVIIIILIVMALVP